jgi:hypothetical protein
LSGLRVRDLDAWRRVHRALGGETELLTADATAFVVGAEVMPLVAEVSEVWSRIASLTHYRSPGEFLSAFTGRGIRTGGARASLEIVIPAGWDPRQLAELVLDDDDEIIARAARGDDAPRVVCELDRERLAHLELLARRERVTASAYASAIVARALSLAWTEEAVAYVPPPLPAAQSDLRGNAERLNAERLATWMGNNTAGWKLLHDGPAEVWERLGDALGALDTLRNAKLDAAYRRTPGDIVEIATNALLSLEPARAYERLAPFFEPTTASSTAFFLRRTVPMLTTIDNAWRAGSTWPARCTASA